MSAPVLHHHHRAILRDRYGLTDQTIDAAGIFSVSAAEANAILGRSDVESGGFAIPYLHPTTRAPLIAQVSGRSYVNIRLDEPHPLKRAPSPPPSGGDVKAARYLKPAGDARIYFPPLVDWTKPPGSLVLVTEGELKALAACQHGIPCIGPQGVWAGLRKDGKGGYRLLPDWEPVLPALKQKHVCIIGDSDLAFNDQARQGLATLASLLAPHVKKVKFVLLPGGKGGEKVGLDDFLKARGAYALTGHIKQAPDLTPDAKKAKEAPPLVIESSDEFLAGRDEPIAWVVQGLVARNAIAMLAGSPKVGKTLFIAAMLRAILAGEDFLGLLTAPAKVLYLTEERRPTLRRRWAAVGLEPHPDLRIVQRGRNPQPFVAVIEHVLAEVKAGRADLVVFDTISAWWAIKENEADAVNAAMGLLSQLAEAGAAVLLVHHRRKMAADEPGEGVRGSTAITAAVDIILELRRSRKAGAPPNVRELYGVGRFDETPEALAYQLREGGKLVSLGNVDQWAQGLVRERVLNALRKAPSGLTAEEVGNAAGVNKGTALKVLADLLAQGWVVVTGTGKPGDPKRYSMIGNSASLSPHSPHFAQTQSGRGVQVGRASVSPLSPESGESVESGGREESGESGEAKHSSPLENRATTGSGPIRSRGELVEMIATADQPPAALCEPPRMGDGTCYRCNGRRWWRAPDGRWLCSACYPPLETLRQWEAKAA